MVDGVKGVDRAVLIRTSMGASRRSVKKRQVLSQSLALERRDRPGMVQDELELVGLGSAFFSQDLSLQLHEPARIYRCQKPWLMPPWM